MELREMKEEDLNEIMRLEKKLFVHDPWSKGAYLSELKDNPFAQLAVLEHDGKILGYYDLWITYEQAQIATFGVAKEVQGQGYGQYLLEHMIQIAEENGCEYLSLEVRVSNEVAIHLYEKNGFLTVNIRKHYYKNYEDAYYMVKALKGGQDGTTTSD